MGAQALPAPECWTREGLTRVRTCHLLAPHWMQPWTSSAALGEQELGVCSGMPVAPWSSRLGQQQG